MRSTITISTAVAVERSARKRANKTSQTQTSTRANDPRLSCEQKGFMVGLFKCCACSRYRKYYLIECEHLLKRKIRTQVNVKGKETVRIQKTNMKLKRPHGNVNNKGEKRRYKRKHKHCSQTDTGTNTGSGVREKL